MTLAQRLGWAFLILATTAAATFAVLFAGGSGRLELWQVRVIYDAMAVAAIVAWLLVAAFRRDWLPSSRLVPAILACLAAFAITTITSQVPRLSAEMLGYAILLAELYLLLVTLMRRPRMREHLERLALLLCLLVSVLYLLRVLQLWQLWWTAVGHLTIPSLRPGYEGLSLGSPNPIATLVLVLGAFALATGPLGRRGGQALVAVLVVLVAITTLVTGSRGAWIGAGAGLAAATLAAFATSPPARMRATTFLRARAGAGALMVGLAALVAAGALAAGSGRLTLDDSGYRAAFAAASVRMLESSPLAGVGPGVWQVLRASHTAAPQPDLYIPHAHNIYLQTLAEFGLVGVVAGLVVVGSLAGLILDGIRTGDGVRWRVGLATLFGVVLLAGQQLADVLVNVPAVLLAIAVPVAWLDATAAGPAPQPGPVTPEPSQGPPGARARVVVLGMAVLTLVVGVGLVRIEVVTAKGLQGVSAADRGQWTEALGPAMEAAVSDPAVNSSWFAAGVIAANAGDLPVAADALERSAAADDYPIAWLDLAAVRWRQGDVTGARMALERAERLGLQRASVAVAAGWLRWQLGDRAEAVRDYGAAVAAQPTLADDPFWESDPALSAVRPAIREAARREVERSPGSVADHAPRLFKLRLLEGDVAAATGELAPLLPGDRAAYDQVAAAWRGDPGAADGLQRLAEGNPRDAAVVEWCRLIAARNGEKDLVARYGAWLADGLAAAPPVARIAVGPPLSSGNVGVDRYGSLYRRSVPAAQVIGILPQLRFQDHF